jgi:uncharacterized protein YjbJ (UPF0337 family)
MTSANSARPLLLKSARKGGLIMASGKSDKVKGRVKEAAGALTGNKKLKRKGLADQAVGNIKQMMEDAIEMVENFFDWVRGLFA